jgi:shikimate kinase
MINNNIFLIGMMGTGKSTIASQLSQALKRTYIDTDQDILSILDVKISYVSESKFRKLESVYFLERIKNDYCIYATGGGIILSGENRECIRNNGIGIFLDTSIDILYERLIKTNLDTRPLLDKINLKEQLDTIWKDREEYYESCAKIKICTNNLTEKELIEKIIVELQKL